MRNLFDRITIILGIIFFGGFGIMGIIFYVMAIVNAILN